jgi:hypothetical protein
LLERALAKKREDRFADAGAFLSALDQIDRRVRGSSAPLARRSDVPSLREVLRVNSVYAASMTQLGLRRLPTLVTWSGTQLRRASVALRRLRASNKRTES